jgi:aminoglycoside phosphotransferase (APT) family kinase protein
MADKGMIGDNATIEVRKGEGLDIDAVDAVLKDSVAGLSGQPKVTQYPSGNSNLTYAIDYPERRMVLRRPPFGPLPKAGHNMFREYRIMRDLKPAFDQVPRTVFYTDDESIIGKEFYVMDRVDGPLIHKTIPPEWKWSEDDTATLGENFIDALAKLHSLDYKKLGLEDFGKPEGYVKRQITGWNKRWNNAWTDGITKFEDVQKWLEDEMPAESGNFGVLHGDYRVDNAILDAKDPRKIAALLDWEICAIGDPLMDLGNTLSYWIEASDPAPMHMMIRQPSAAPGMPSRREFADRYGEKTGYDVSDIHYHFVYGIWRLAVIIQQIHARYVRGQTQDERFAVMDKSVEALGALARHKIETGNL